LQLDPSVHAPFAIYNKYKMHILCGIWIMWKLIIATTSTKHYCKLKCDFIIIVGNLCRIFTTTIEVQRNQWNQRHSNVHHTQRKTNRFFCHLTWTFKVLCPYMPNNVIRKVRRLRGKNGQFQHNRSSNTTERGDRRWKHRLSQGIGGERDGDFTDNFTVWNKFVIQFQP
jgi:hypothetical protein